MAATSDQLRIYVARVVFPQLWVGRASSACCHYKCWCVGAVLWSWGLPAGPATAGLSAQSTTMEFSVRSMEQDQQQQAEQDTVQSLEEGEDSGEYEEVDQEEDKDTEGPEKPAADEDDDEEEDDDDDDVAAPPTEGSYDPSEFDHLAVDSEVRELFTHIVKYTPQTIELESKFKPFVPDYIPAVGKQPPAASN